MRRMLKLDPAERASIPEVFNHIWLRSLNGVHHFDVPSSSSIPLGPGSRVRGCRVVHRIWWLFILMCVYVRVRA